MQPPGTYRPFDPELVCTLEAVARQYPWGLGFTLQSLVAGPASNRVIRLAARAGIQTHHLELVFTSALSHFDALLPQRRKWTHASQALGLPAREVNIDLLFELSESRRLANQHFPSDFDTQHMSFGVSRLANQGTSNNHTQIVRLSRRLLDELRARRLLKNRASSPLSPDLIRAFIGV